jgi:predicted dehydrogenase
MEAIATHTNAEIVGYADPSAERRDAARILAPRARACEHLGQLFELDLDGLVIATPSAMHAEQAIAALSRGLSVFCQKPLGRTAVETAAVVSAARAGNRLLGLDLSYRHTRAMQSIREVVRSGELGTPYGLDLVFHNAYGPEAASFYDKGASGCGGCVIDLGGHLVDLALWLLEFPGVESVDSRLFAKGKPLEAGARQVEDFASVQLTLTGGAVIRLTCSWHMSIGCDAVIEASVYGPHGGVAMRNTDGSFYDFIAERYRGTITQRLVEPPDEWSGRAAIAWTEQLASGAQFDPESERFVALARVLDAIYAGGLK